MAIFTNILELFEFKLLLTYNNSNSVNCYDFHIFATINFQDKVGKKVKGSKLKFHKYTYRSYDT